MSWRMEALWCSIVLKKELGHHWFKGMACHLSVSNWTLGDKIHLYFHQNVVIFIQENTFEDVCKMAEILL